MEKIRFLTLQDIIALHRAAMEMTGDGPAGLVRHEALESATHQAKNAAWYLGAAVPEIAVHLTTHIALAHPWVDGNKRTSVMAGVQFLLINGAHDPSEGEVTEFADLLIKYIEADHDGRDAIFAEFVHFVETWFS